MNPDGVFLSNGPGDPELVPTRLKRPKYFWKKACQYSVSVLATRFWRWQAVQKL